MARKPLDILKSGLNALKKQVFNRKTGLEAQLRSKERISEADEEWLDNEGNVVDEQRVLDALEAASDYERGLGRLSEVDKGIVQKLRELAGDVSKVIGRKRKHSCSFCL